MVVCGHPMKYIDMFLIGMNGLYCSQVHVTVMLFTALLTIFGAALAFLYVGSWSEVSAW